MFLFSFSIFFLLLFLFFLIRFVVVCIPLFICILPPINTMKKNCVCKEIHVVKYLPSSHMANIKCIFPYFFCCVWRLCISVFLFLLFSGCHIIKSIHINKTTHYTYLPTIILMLRTWHLKNEQHQQQNNNNKKSFYAVHVVRVTLLYDQHYACRIYFRFYISRFFSPSDR